MKNCTIAISADLAIFRVAFLPVCLVGDRDILRTFVAKKMIFGTAKILSRDTRFQIKDMHKSVAYSGRLGRDIDGMSGTVADMPSPSS